MLHKGIQDSANTERWLDDIWYEFSSILCSSSSLNDNQVLANLDLAIANTLDINGDLALLLEILRQCFALVLWQSLDSSFNCLAILLEMRTKLLLVEVDLPFRDTNGLRQSLSDHQR